MLRVLAPLLQSELTFVVLVADLFSALQGVGWEMQRASRCRCHLPETPWQVLEAGYTSSAPCCRDTLLPLWSLGPGAMGIPVPTVAVPSPLQPALCKESSKIKFYQSSPTVWCTPKEKQKQACGPSIPWHIATARLRAPACGAAPSCAGWGLEPFYFSSWA